MTTEEKQTHTVTLELPAWLYRTFSVAAVAFDKTVEEMILEELADVAEADFIASNRLGDYFKTLREEPTEA